MSRILAFTALAATVLAGIGALGTPASAQPRIEAGVLECKGRGGWGQILVSRKEFLCNFTSVSGKQLGRYRAVVTKYGLDIGVTSNATVVWGVFAPADLGGPNYVVGSLDGDYVGVGAKASVGVGLGANALVGGGARSFALQPVSVESQTGLNLAVGVQQLSLTFLEKL